MPHRPSAFNDFQNTISTWTVGNVSVADDDDQDRLGRFLAELDRRPTWKATFLDILGRTGNVVEAISGCHQPAQIQVPAAPATQVVAVTQPPAPSQHSSSPVPKNPMRFSAARERFKEHSLRNRTTVSRTTQDRYDFLQKVWEHVIDIDDRLDKDPWVHHIHTHHLASFMDASAERVGRQDSKEARGSVEPEKPNEHAAEVKTLKAASLLKRLSDMSAFFTWAHREVQAALENPIDGLEARRRKLTQQANDEKTEYLPFESHHLTTIFDPERYLMESRFSDYFWTPLLALHLGTRLKELVTMELRSIGCEEDSGIWYMDVKPEFAKNKNSVRRLPIVQPLIDLGFLEYVEQMRELGAKNLFPHRDLTGNGRPLSGKRLASLLPPPRLIHPSIALMNIRITALDASTSAQSIAAFAWRLARRTSAVLMAATLGWAALPSPSFAQTNSARDVAGVTLGMSPGEVEAVLRAHNPSFKMLKVYWRAADGKPATAVAKLGGALPSRPSDRINTSRGYSRPEAIMVYFTQTDGKAFAVYRQVVNKQTGMSATEIEAQLKAKYGVPDGFKGQYRLYRRMLDNKGQPNPGCGHRGFDWESAPGSQSRGCGMSVEAQFSDPIGPDVYTMFQTWMVDHQVAERDARTLQAQQAQAANEAATKVRGAARSNRLGL